MTTASDSAELRLACLSAGDGLQIFSRLNQYESAGDGLWPVPPVHSRRFWRQSPNSATVAVFGDR